ncbi:MAG TPA: ABC transporter ATP-binding protein [Candidatus Paceibacterota bacterium]
MEGEKKNNVTRSAITEMLRNGRRVLGMAYRAKPGLMIGILIVFAIAAAAGFGSSGTRALLINELVALPGNGWSNSIILLLLATLLMNILPDVIGQLQEYWRWKLWFVMEEELNVLLLKQRGLLDIATHEDPKTQDLFTRVNEAGVWRMSNFVQRMLFVLQNLIEIVLAGLIILAFKWWVFLIVFLGVIPTLIVEAKYSRGVYGIDTAGAEVKRRYWDLGHRFKNLSDLVEIKLTGLTKNFTERIVALFRQFRGPEEAKERAKFVRGASATLLSNVTIAVALGWTIDQVLGGTMQVGTLTFIFTSIYTLRQSLSGLLQNLANQYKDSLYLTDTFAFLDLAPRLDTTKSHQQITTGKTPSIVFENVSFGYKTGTSPILKGVNLRIDSGEKLAIVGVNGAGKTTLIKLLCRFYDPTGGRILVDGIDLREIDLASWYDTLGAIFQDYSRYHFTVKESIAVGTPGIGPVMENVVTAAHNAEANIFIEEFEKGYDQQLGQEFEGGVQPSTGQWQKLALARTFYRDPRIFILDEPTSSIDAEAEAKIFDKLEALPDDRTVILISHRFSTVRHANKIVVIESGTISEGGSHEELLKLDGTYARLFKLQAKGYE